MDKTRNINECKAIKRIESELLLALFDYAVPFLGEKLDIKKQKDNQKTGSLEDIAANSKPKIGLRDLKELESLLLANLSKDIKINKSSEVNSGNAFYSLNFKRQKANNEKSGKYSVSIKYEENQTGDKLKISIKKAEKEVYSAEVADKKEAKDKVFPYSFKIIYENDYSEERLKITYKQQLKGYMKRHIEDKEDMASRVPLKWLNILPETMMGGVLGFTYLGENFMGRRADLTGKTARMVDIHESIHTPDEYETRILTSWIMEKARSRYIK